MTAHSSSPSNPDPDSSQRSISKAETWERRYAELIQFCRIHGHTQVSAKTGAHMRLGSWLSEQRRMARAGKLSGEKTRLLSLLEIEWNPTAGVWVGWLRKLQDFHRVHGHCRVPKKWRQDPALGRWVARQRSLHAEGRLGPDEVRELEGIGFSWSVQDPAEAGQAKWEAQRARLAAFQARFGHCHVPKRWKEEPGLGEWVRSQRTAKRKSRLAPERLRLLEQVSPDWDRLRKPAPAGADHRFAQLAAFRERFGHCCVPRYWKEEPGLGEWVRSQRVAKRKGKLSPERLARLDAAGFEWQLPLRSAAHSPQSGSAKMDRLANRLAQLAAFRERFGHCCVPKRWKEEPGLGEWVRQQRFAKRKGELSLERMRMLDEMGFSWDIPIPPRPDRAAHRCAQLAAFRERFGHCRVPRYWKEDPSLGEWVRSQRVARRKGRLSPERLQRLDAIGFDWQTRQPGSP